MIFFFNDTATTEIYTLSLHDALPILGRSEPAGQQDHPGHRPCAEELERTRGVRHGHRHPEAGGSVEVERRPVLQHPEPDRKSTRLNSSHANISYAVFCLKKKN